MEYTSRGLLTCCNSCKYITCIVVYCALNHYPWSCDITQPRLQREIALAEKRHAWSVMRYLSYDLRARFRETSQSHWGNPIAMQPRNASLILGGLQMRGGRNDVRQTPFELPWQISARPRYTNKLRNVSGWCTARLCNAKSPRWDPTQPFDSTSRRLFVQRSNFLAREYSGRERIPRTRFATAKSIEFHSYIRTACDINWEDTWRIDGNSFN